MSSTEAERTMTQSEEVYGRPRHRWLVLAACFVCHLTTVSVSYHAGVLHVALLDTYHQDVVTTAWLGSVYACMPSLVGPLASLVIIKFDCRTCLIMSGIMAGVGASCCFFITQFFLLYPALILAGIGQGFSLVSSYVAIGYNFPQQASLLTGFCVCGSGLGIFIHPPLLQTLVDRFGLRGALLVIGAVSLNSVPCGLAIPPSPYEKQRHLARKQRNRGSSKTTVASFRSRLDVLTDFRFLLLLLTALGFSSGLACYYLYLPDFLLHNNYDAMTASFVLSSTGMGSIPSRLLTGVTTNDSGVDIMTFFFSIHALAAVGIILVPFTVGSLVAQMVLAVVFGIYTGAAWASYSPLLLDMLGVQRVATGLGVYIFTMGVGYVAVPPLVAKIYTSSNNFHHVFYFTAAMLGLASAVSMVSTLMKPKDDKRPPVSWTSSTRLAHFSRDNDLHGQHKDSLLAGAETRNMTIVVDINTQDRESKRSSSGELTNGSEKWEVEDTQGCLDRNDCDVDNTCCSTDFSDQHIEQSAASEKLLDDSTCDGPEAVAGNTEKCTATEISVKRETVCGGDDTDSRSSGQ